MISHNSEHPSLYPRVIITDASAGEVDEETISKGSTASASMLSFSAEEEEGGVETLHSAVRMDDVDTVSDDRDLGTLFLFRPKKKKMLYCPLGA